MFATNTPNVGHAKLTIVFLATPVINEQHV